MDKVSKLTAVQFSDEMKAAVSLLIAAFEDCELQSYIRFAYRIDDKAYELTFLPKQNEIIYKTDEKGDPIGIESINGHKINDEPKVHGIHNHA